MNEPKYKAGDRVRLLDGRGIKDFTANWSQYMADWIGCICTIERVSEQWSKDGKTGYFLEESVFVWDERAMELCHPAEQ